MLLLHTRKRIVQITKVLKNKVDIIFADPDLKRVAETFTCQLCIELSITLLLLNIHSIQITNNYNLNIQITAINVASNMPSASQQ